MFARVMLAWAVLALEPAWTQRGRYMPPPAVGCDRNNLTSYTGEITSYSRKRTGIRMRMRSDERTVESFSLRQVDKVLLNGQPFTPKDWTQVEDQQGRLKPGMRATVWVCKGGRPVLDWQPPAH